MCLPKTDFDLWCDSKMIYGNYRKAFYHHLKAKGITDPDEVALGEEWSELLTTQILPGLLRGCDDEELTVQDVGDAVCMDCGRWQLEGDQLEEKDLLCENCHQAERLPDLRLCEDCLRDLYLDLCGI